MSLHELLERHHLPAVADGGKDDKGRVFVIGGPAHCPGAVLLAATAALRCGAGRVQAAADPAVAGALGVAVPEAAVFAWNQTSSPPPQIVRHLVEADVVLIGVGHTQFDDIVTRSVAERASNATLILDAGALQAAVAVARIRPVVIAPNPMEARRLLEREDDRDDEEALARALTARLEQPVAVRGPSTVIAHGDECWRFDDAPPGLGTPGSGDVFAGALAALVATGLDATAALAWAVYLHAEAGRRLSEATPVGYLARELVDELPFARPAS